MEASSLLTNTSFFKEIILPSPPNLLQSWYIKASKKPPTRLYYRNAEENKNLWFLKFKNIITINQEYLSKGHLDLKNRCVLDCYKIKVMKIKNTDLEKIEELMRFFPHKPWFHLVCYFCSTADHTHCRYMMLVF